MAKKEAPMKEAPKTPAQRIQEMLKAWVKEFSKTPYIYPVSIGVAAGVYYLVLLYATGVCLIGLITPLVLLGMLWMFNVRSAKRLAIVGLVAVLVLGGVWLAAFTNHYTNVKPGVSSSEDGKTLTDGIVTPLHGSTSQSYNFTITAHLKKSPTNETIYFKNVTVAVSSVKFPGGVYENHTMNLLKEEFSPTENRTIQYYYYDATVPSPINVYLFWAEYPNGSVEVGAVRDQTGTASFQEGPISTDAGAVALTLLPYAYLQTLVNVYVAYFLIVGMIWWTRRARRMREQQIERWRKEEEEKEAAQPKKELKVPSLARAMGTDKGEGETFVCSECGADVPADATVCPKCGEKFD